MVSHGMVLYGVDLADLPSPRLQIYHAQQAASRHGRTTFLHYCLLFRRKVVLHLAAILNPFEKVGKLHVLIFLMQVVVMETNATSKVGPHLHLQLRRLLQEAMKTARVTEVEVACWPGRRRAARVRVGPVCLTC